MTKNALRILAPLAALAALLTACSSLTPHGDALVGKWYQNGGQVDLIWDFNADKTVHVQTWTGTGQRNGVYRHLEGNRVVLDFGNDVFSVVEITVSGTQMTMVTPTGARTVIERNK